MAPEFFLGEWVLDSSKAKPSCWPDLYCIFASRLSPTRSQHTSVQIFDSMECLDVPVGCQTPDKNFEELRGEGAPGLPHSWEPMQWGPAMPLCGCGLPW